MYEDESVSFGLHVYPAWLDFLMLLLLLPEKKRKFQISNFNFFFETAKNQLNWYTFSIQMTRAAQFGVKLIRKFAFHKIVFV